MKPNRTGNARAGEKSLRRGLAPVEMVMALPILLFLMALIINFGAVATWRVRGETAARHAAWMTRPHDGSVGPATPRPEWWPRPDAVNPTHGATLNAHGAHDAPNLDAAFPPHAVARGPGLDAGGQNRVITDRLDLGTGFRRGDSSLTRNYPLLTKLGSYTMKTEIPMLADEWMHPFHGLSSNDPIESLWFLARRDDLGLAFYNNMLAIYQSPNWSKRQLVGPNPHWTLPQDNDIVYYERRIAGYASVLGLAVPTSNPTNYFDSYTSVRNLPFVDPDQPALLDTVRQRVDETIDRVKGRPQQNGQPSVESVARHMADQYGGNTPNDPSDPTANLDGYYGSVVNRLNYMIDQVTSGLLPIPPPPGIQAAMEADRTEVLQKRDEMQKYRDSIN